MGDATDDETERVAKKPRVMQRYRSEYSVSYPVITRSSLSQYNAYCSVCKADFSVSHGGLTDVKQHIGTAKHVRYAKDQTTTHKLQDFFCGNKDLSVIRAETLFTEFLVEHNLPVACSDHAAPLF